MTQVRMTFKRKLNFRLTSFILNMFSLVTPPKKKNKKKEEKNEKVSMLANSNEMNYW